MARAPVFCGSRAGAAASLRGRCLPSGTACRPPSQASRLHAEYPQFFRTRAGVGHCGLHKARPTMAEIVTRVERDRIRSELVAHREVYELTPGKIAGFINANSQRLKGTISADSIE